MPFLRERIGGQGKALGVSVGVQSAPVDALTLYPGLGEAGKLAFTYPAAQQRGKILIRR